MVAEVKMEFWLKYDEMSNCDISVLLLKFFGPHLSAQRCQKSIQGLYCPSLANTKSRSGRKAWYGPVICQNEKHDTSIYLHAASRSNAGTQSLTRPLWFRGALWKWPSSAWWIHHKMSQDPVIYNKLEWSHVVMVWWPPMKHSADRISGNNGYIMLHITFHASIASHILYSYVSYILRKFSNLSEVVESITAPRPSF